MKKEYTIKEVFDENSKELAEKLNEIFISFLPVIGYNNYNYDYDWEVFVCRDRFIQNLAVY